MRYSSNRELLLKQYRRPKIFWRDCVGVKEASLREKNREEILFPFRLGRGRVYVLTKGDGFTTRQGHTE